MAKKVLLPFLVSMFFLNQAECGQSPDSLLTVLKAEMLKKSDYDRQKEIELKELKQALPSAGLSTRYTLLDEITEIYKNYKFDSAHVYIHKLLEISKLLNDPQKQYESGIKLGALQLSWGMYKEVFESIDLLKASLLPDSTRLRYYELKARALKELAEYNTSRFYSPANQTESIRTLDSAVVLSKPDSYDKYKYTGQLLAITGQNEKALAILRQLLQKSDLTIHQRAMVTNDLSYFVSTAEKEKLLMQAAIWDIRSSTKQTLACFRLGTSLLDRGELDDAEIMLNEALSEAVFFGNKLREKEITIALTQLSAQKLIRAENQKNNILLVLIAGVTLGLIGVAIVSYIVYRRLIKVKLREATVQGKYQYLDAINKRLSEDGKIKEEYIGYFFHLISGYLSKLGNLKRDTEHKLKIKNYEELMQLAKEIDIKKEREDLFYTFDTIFLKLFPNFIDAFNALLKPEDKICPRKNELLNVNLRIFALMRLGISDTQTIANILESTLSTVYTYKNRIKSKALFHGEAFDAKIMEIKFAEPPVIFK